MRMERWGWLAMAAGVAACGGQPVGREAPAAAATSLDTVTVRDTVIPAILEASGVAEPVERATLATRLMGTVTAVLVREGERVAAGQVLARIDARDVEAKRAQVEAGLAQAEAVRQDAETQARRFRALYADSAATKAQLEAVETGLARAEAAVSQARAARAEVQAIGGYAEVRAPFAGLVTRRWVDPGAFAAPGAPLVEVQDASRLRIAVAVAPAVAGALRRGQEVEALVEGRPVAATIEGVVPAPAGAVYTVNALVANRDRGLLPGSAATLRLPAGERHAVLVPAAALVVEGDLVGVRVKGAAGPELRWVKVGRRAGGRAEVLAGLADGDVVVVPAERTH